MKKKIFRGLLCFLLCISGASVMAGEKVLVVHSYHAGYSWTDSIDAGINEAFKGSDAQITSHFMDTKRNTSEEFMQNAGKLCDAEVAALKPAVVITTDDNAQLYFAKNYAGREGAPTFVFCGVNSEPELFGFPAVNVTGVLERPFFDKSIDMLRKINPSIRKIGCISDSGITGKTTMGQITSDKVEIIGKRLCGTFDEWKAAIMEFNGKVDAIAILLYHTIREKPGDTTSMSPEKVMEWTMQNTALPTVGFWEFAVNDGALCAIAASGADHGLNAGKMAQQIIGGKKASEVPVITSSKGLIMLNLKNATKNKFKVPYDLIKVAYKIIK
ncbi:MAG: hypothetical protein CVV64_12825 [Candidatus Wallbacteria bacterium HGW-Wallbacteria-1]|jgi:ABC-type uncharacterized transport system substrate-binding protein|uniref:ABC transporter substrate-binding protein n=1 Tax=Candidatus Wallbacteria bacterium HGW-Wallbacteria-1 TaxID=2013854 RepID=A0A2N1PMU5_9BACT|nr:MAG: hypothetical protein CVV64_12825 [Candidatus Wallbacteria bacterium HGW-Wallbacteria-1]